MKKIAIIGAGGFGQEVFCIWRDQLNFENKEFQFLGFFDDDISKNNIYGEVIGKIDDLNYLKEEIEVAIAVGNVNHLKGIKDKISNPKIVFPNIIHPTVQFLDKKNANLGIGNIFSIGVILSCDVSLGDFNICNTRVTLGHHTSVGDYNIFSSNAQISGSVEIKNQNFFGFNSGILQNLKIGSKNIIGSGSILLRNIKDGNSYFGLPAKKIEI